jgi:hypothetical protein
MGSYEVREATADELPVVRRLVQDEYTRQGYCRPEGGFSHYSHLDGIPQTTCFIALKRGQLIGTNSLTEDGPAELHVDEDFPEQVDAIRDECLATHKRLGASWRIVTADSARGSIGVVMDLINATVHHGAGRLDVILFSFNPRHERVYRRILDLETIAIGSCRALAGSPPAVLMRGDAQRILPRWQAVCRQWQLPFDIDISRAISWSQKGPSESTAH